MNVDGPQKMKVDFPKMRGRLRRDESGRSSKVCGSLQSMKVDRLEMCGRSTKGESGQSQNAWVVETR